MNCGYFQKCLPEYLDGTLSVRARAAAERHLAGCDACRQVVRKEQHFSERLTSFLRNETETLRLAAGIRRNILAAAARKPAPSTVAEIFIGAWRRLAWPLAIAALVTIAAGLLLDHFLQPMMPAVNSAQSSRPPTATAQSPVVAVQIAYHQPAMKFHREGNLVVDTLAYETIVASETLRPGDPNAEP